MIKLKTILSEGYAWEREAGKPLPTLEQTTAAHAAKQAEQSAEQPLSNPIDEVQTFHGDPDEIFEEIAEYLVDDGHAPSFKAAMHALDNTSEDYETIIGVYMSDHLTRDEAISTIADLIDIRPRDNDQQPMPSNEGAKPDFLDLDKDGNEEESMKDAAADREDMAEAFARRMRGNLKGSEHILTETFRRK